MAFFDVLDSCLVGLNSGQTSCNNKDLPMEGKADAFTDHCRLVSAQQGLSFVLCPSPSMQQVYQLISRISQTDQTVLLQGETGVGKDLLAYFIHSQSKRRFGSLVTVDCGLLSQNLAESELYGHCKGAFSGATETKLGLVEKSQGGTLFLDEIGNIHPELQKKFLRFLETRCFRRIGETKEQRIDTRIILATNLDLQNAVHMGELRSDLFYRMAEFCITIPPLRERPEDIIPLANFMLNQLNSNIGPIKISKEAGQIMMQYDWPGNIREIKSAIAKAALLSDSQTIRVDDLPPEMHLKRCPRPIPSRTLKDMEKEHIMRVLADTGGNQTKASAILGINRKTLYKKIRQYKI